MKNTISIRREIDGYDIRALATYQESVDGWTCHAREGAIGPWSETRGPDETGNDAIATLMDMIDLVLDEAHQRNKFNAGPFSSAQCR